MDFFNVKLYWFLLFYILGDDGFPFAKYPKEVSYTSYQKLNSGHED